MDPLDAVQLDEWFPRVTDCVIRGGASNHVTGFVARPKTLMLHTPPTGTNKMFASSNTGVYDVTSAGAVGASVATSTNGYWNWVQMGVSGGQYLLMFNGVDKPNYYDGTTWTAVDGASVPAITGVTTTNLVTANVYKHRLFLIELNKLSFWYLPVDVVGGAAVEFPLGIVTSKGGFCTAMGTWSFDGGNGPDDYAVFITSEGQAIIFSGTDPGSSVNWSHVGTYDLPKPLGRKCLQKYKGDLVYLCEAGVLPLSKALQSSSIDREITLTDKINEAFTIAARGASAIEGWEATIFPAQSAFLFNIPDATSFRQFVMNTTTKQWCRFNQGWNDAESFVVFNRDLYFAGDDKVAKAWTGTSDFGDNIIAMGQQAFNYFKRRNYAKKWTMMRPHLLTNGPVQFSHGLAIDFSTNTTLQVATYSTLTAARWDVDRWDAGYWASGLENQKEWQTPSAKEGYCASVLLQIATNALEVHWIATDLVWLPAGVMG